MSDNNFDAIIAEGRARLADATEGQWEADGSEIYRADAYEDGRRVWVGETCDVDNDALGDANAELIAWMRNNLPALLDRIETLQLGGQTLGKSLVALNQIALDATGMHDVIGENGDGDWGAVWENVSDLGADLRAARKRIAELEAWQQRQVTLARRAITDLERFRAIYDPNQPDLAIVIDTVLDERDSLRARVAELEAQVR